jgi:hypothetical protein
MESIKICLTYKQVFNRFHNFSKNGILIKTHYFIIIVHMKNCPSCWRPIKFEEKYARILACGYCNSILEFWTGELSKIWEQSEFIEFPTIFEVWKKIDWKGFWVHVKWRLRFEYDWGFFDKFFVIINGKEYFIQEDEGITKLLSEWDWQQSEEWLLDKTVWEMVVIQGEEVFVQESWIFKLTSMKGVIPTTLIPGNEYEYLDALSWWKWVYYVKEIWTNRIRIWRETSA